MFYYVIICKIRNVGMGSMLYKDEFESKYKKNSCKEIGSYTRMLFLENEKLGRPVWVELESFNDGKLNIRMYDSFDKKAKYVDKDEAKEFAVKKLNSEMPNRGTLPICSAKASQICSIVTLEHLETLEPYRRKGIASFVLKLVEDYYMRSSQAQSKVKNPQNGQVIYARLENLDKDLLDKTRLEQKMGAVGSVISYVRNKALGYIAEDAAMEFLSKNGFSCASSRFFQPVKEMESANIICDELLDENNKKNYIQIFDTPVEINPEMLKNDDHLMN